MNRRALPLFIVLAPIVFAAGLADAEPIAVRFAEGITRGFPVLRSEAGTVLAHGELSQVATADRVESRMTFRFTDGSIYDETVVYSQRDLFKLLSYRIVQQGPSFPETLDGRFDRETRRWEVRHQADQDSPLEQLSGRIDLPDDVYNGMLSTVMKNLADGVRSTVRIVAFTPKPRLIEILIAPNGKETVDLGAFSLSATRYLVKPQLGLLASLLVTDLPPTYVWVLRDGVPAFARFQGALYFLGPIWRIDPN